MKIKVILGMFFIFITTKAMLNIPKPSSVINETTKSCYDLMMILDPNIEHKDNSNLALTFALAQALRERSFPIIVSSNIMEIFSLQKQKYVWGTFYPSDNDWYGYSHKTAPLILLMPKKYINNFVQNLSFDITEQFKKCGFDVTTLHQFENFMPETLLSYIKKQGLTSNSEISEIAEQYTISARDIASMFVINQKDKLKTTPSWNIILDGHGTYLRYKMEKALIAGLDEIEFFKLMEFFQKIKTSFLHYFSCYSGGQNLIKVKEYLSGLKVNFMVSAQGINESLAWMSTVHSTKSFTKLNTFFGNPKGFTQRVKREKWENDPIASIVSDLISKEFLDWAQPWIYIPKVGVFDALSVDKSIKILTKSLTKAYEFEGTIIDFTHPDVKTIMIYPNYVGIPLKIKAHVAIVSPTGLMVENKPVTFKKQQNNDIITFVSEKSENNVVHIFKKIIYEDILSSIIPNFISFNSSFFPITFIIKKLECFNYDNSGLAVDKSNPLMIENMIITIVGSKVLEKTLVPDPYLDVDITALFTYNNNIYSFSLPTIKRLSENSKLLFDQFKNLPASQLTSEELNTLVINSNVLKNCGISDRSGINMTLENIVKAIESTIDKTTVVQEPGALKRSLLLKQKNILEKEAHEFTLPSMNKQIKKSNKELVLKQPKPLISAVKYWQQRIEKAKKLESEIEKTPFTKQITIKQSDKQEKIQPIKLDEQQIYRQDMVNLQEELQKKYDSALAEQPWQEYLTTNFNKYFNVIKTYPQKFLDKVNEVKNFIFSGWKRIMYQNYQKQR